MVRVRVRGNCFTFVVLDAQLNPNRTLRLTRALTPAVAHLLVMLDAQLTLCLARARQLLLRRLV